MTELFELHDRNRFETFGFDNGWDDGSEIRARINKAFNEIVDIRRMPDLDAASLIKAKGIDILVNLNGYFGEGGRFVTAAPFKSTISAFLTWAPNISLLVDSTLIPNTSQCTSGDAYLPTCYRSTTAKER
jgi:predicted O-linked N-acetylglucosamine transferase (SPINDLY family)